MEKSEEIRELGEDCTSRSKLVWGYKNRFKVYYDRQMMCPYVLCVDGKVHAMFSELDDAENYVWECW